MIIKHKKHMDICFEVQNVYYSTGQIMGRRINMGYIKSWYLPNKAGNCVFIENKEDWLKCIDENVPCFRYTSWGSL